MTVWFGMLVASSSLLFLEMQVHGSEISTEFVVHGASFISGGYYFTQSVSDCFRNCLTFVSAVLLSTYSEGGEHCTTLEDVIKGNSFFLSLGVRERMIATSGQRKPAESVSLTNILWLHLC